MGKSSLHAVRCEDSRTDFALVEEQSGKEQSGLPLGNNVFAGEVAERYCWVVGQTGSMVLISIGDAQFFNFLNNVSSCYFRHNKIYCGCG